MDKIFHFPFQLQNSSGDSFGLFGQLLTDDHHRVGQFGPARLGRLMCGTFKFIFVADARFGEEKFEAEQKRRKYRFVENSASFDYWAS